MYPSEESTWGDVCNNHGAALFWGRPYVCDSDSDSAADIAFIDFDQSVLVCWYVFQAFTGNVSPNVTQITTAPM